MIGTIASDPIPFQAVLLRPIRPRNASWAFLVLPNTASARLPSRGQVTVVGTLAGAPFQATLEPDGDGGHWLKVPRTLRDAVGVAIGDTVAVAVTPVGKELEPRLPADFRQALAGNAAAQATWKDITPMARRDWIHWIASGKKAQTRVKRIAAACDMLASGKRRACCFDRSGQYSRGSMGVPDAAGP